jgi:tetratricopeptide (TPR) repeat protein
LLDEAEQAFAALDDRDGRATVLHLRGTIASQQGDYDAARASYQHSLDIRRELDDRPKIGALLSNLAVVAEQVGDYETARELNERALQVREDVGDPWAIAVSQNNLGMIALLQEDFARATEHIAQSIALAGKVGDRWIAAVGEHNNGIAQRGLRDFAASAAAFLEALQAYVDYDDRWSLMLLAEDVVFLAVDTGQDDAALRLVAAADELRTSLEAPRPPALQRQLDAALTAVGVVSGPAAEEPTERLVADGGPSETIREVCRACAV